MHTTILTTPSSRQSLKVFASHFLSTNRHSCTARRHANVFDAPPRFANNRWSNAQKRSASSSPLTSTVSGLGENLSNVSKVQGELEALRVASGLPQVWSIYESLAQKNLLHTIGQSEMGRISHSVEKELERGVPAGDESKNLEALALHCAANGRPTALCRLLVEHLRREEVSSVLKAYNCYSQSAFGRRGSESPSDDGMDLLDESLPNDSDLLSLVIMAHAYRNDFAGALRAVLQSSSLRVPTSKIVMFLNELATPQTVRERLTSYIPALEIASLASRPEAFRAHVRNLSEPRSQRRLAKLCEQLAVGFEGGCTWAATSESSVSPSRPVFVQDAVWASLIRALVVSCNDALAGRLWTKMAELGVVRTAAIWQALLDGYRETQQFDRVLSAWDSALQSGVNPDVALHCSRILALFDSGRKVQAMQALEEFKAGRLNAAGDAIVVVNASMRSLLRMNDFEGAVDLLKAMSSEGIKPDIVSYNTLIQHHARRGDMKSIFTTVQDLSKTGIQPDIVTFTTIHVALLKAGQAKSTEVLLRVMKDMGIEPNVATYSAMIDRHVRDGTREGIRLGRELLEKMEMTPGARPNEITYTSFLMGLHRNTSVPAEEVEDTTREILRRMEAKGIRVKRGTYHTLLKGALAGSRPNKGLASFHTYYRTMLKNNIKFGHDTWYIILSGLIRRNEWGIAGAMVEDMLKSGFQPMWGVQEMTRSIMQHRNNGSSSGRNTRRAVG